MNLKAGAGYEVIHYDRTFGAHAGEVRFLRCQFCAFQVAPRSFHKQGDKSGQGRYNRARGVIVKHVHSEHAAAIGVTT